jgi:hypothetical protein
MQVICLAVLLFAYASHLLAASPTSALMMFNSRSAESYLPTAGKRRRSSSKKLNRNVTCVDGF